MIRKGEACIQFLEKRGAEGVQGPGQRPHVIRHGRASHGLFRGQLRQRPNLQQRNTCMIVGAPITPPCILRCMTCELSYLRTARIAVCGTDERNVAQTDVIVSTRETRLRNRLHGSQSSAWSLFSERQTLVGDRVNQIASRPWANLVRPTKLSWAGSRSVCYKTAFISGGL
jgi:hypothetical protein